MHPNREEIRKRIAKRKKERSRHPRLPRQHRETKDTKPAGWLIQDDKYGFDELVSYEAGPGEGEHPLFKKEVFFFKVLCSAFLFLVIAILYRGQVSALEPVKGLVQKGFSQDFQFASVSKWYEDKFGKPLALLPEPKKEGEPGNDFSIPATGKILENFEKNGQGIMIETDRGTPVEAVNEGWIMFAGKKEGLGKTVVVQHSDKTESWYGNLDTIEVNLYEFIPKEKEIGTVGAGKDQSKGEFYFAIKKGDEFIDPIQVIRFD
ncbi:M23 family peptidase [Neobacillus notoginsengisoli]|uniref:M23 family peptidase n=1 Tax=Neobacillus notoginsengisoli TaxID=1578198 RepID=A0A417YU01_9BACI|nr:M23 family metallopeptidase [Neobacillus notoginsengisoli]RHW40629.1 M23 family peptidase [Neobacillus notoginsengisoli]